MSIRDDHSLLSSYRESLLKHLFAGEVMKAVWLSGLRRLEVLKPQVDDGGYDLVLEAGDVVRHVQLKATFAGSTVRNLKINLGLAPKPSGCVICMHFDPDTLSLGPSQHPRIAADGVHQSAGHRQHCRQPVRPTSIKPMTANIGYGGMFLRRCSPLTISVVSVR